MSAGQALFQWNCTVCPVSNLLACLISKLHLSQTYMDRIKKKKVPCGALGAIKYCLCFRNWLGRPSMLMTETPTLKQAYKAGTLSKTKAQGLLIKSGCC